MSEYPLFDCMQECEELRKKVKQLESQLEQAERERDEAQRIIELLVVAQHVNQEDVTRAKEIANWG
jgi:hypothetical protein